MGSFASLRGDCRNNTLRRKRGLATGAPQDVIRHKSSIGHAADAGNKGSKGAYDGDEACEHNRLPPMSLVELMRAVKMLTLEETVLAVKGPRTDEVANAVIDRIAQHGCDKQEQKEPAHR